MGWVLWPLLGIGLEGGFVLRTAESGLGAPVCSWGFALGDVDDDGDPDLLVSSHLGSGLSRMGLTVGTTLYHNQGGLRFAPATGAAQPQGAHADPHNIAWVDLDRDRDLDLAVVQGSPKNKDIDALDHYNRFYRNTDGQLALLPTEGEALGVGWRSRGGVWVDLDRDGAADLVAAGVTSTAGRAGGGVLVLRNLGDGRLEPFPNTEVLRRPTEQSFQVSAADPNGDGRPDLLITPSLALYIQQEDGSWRDETAARGLPTAADAASTHWGDVDNDGDEDLVLAITNLILKDVPPEAQQTTGVRLLINDGTGHFTDQTSRLGRVGQVRSRSIVLGDVDNDGDLDLVATAAPTGAHHRLYINQGEAMGWAFVEAGQAVGLLSPGPGLAADASLTDLDGDGRLDLLVAQGAGDCRDTGVGAMELWHNRLDAGHWLGVRLEGRESEPTGLGARVLVVVGGQEVTRVHTGPHHFMSQDSLPLHFGLGEHTRVDEIRVHWPSGRVERFPGTAADERITLVEGQGRP